jgi:hypothetical protein
MYGCAYCILYFKKSRRQNLFIFNAIICFHPDLSLCLSSFIFLSASVNTAQPLLVAGVVVYTLLSGWAAVCALLFTGETTQDYRLFLEHDLA